MDKNEHIKGKVSTGTDSKHISELKDLKGMAIQVTTVTVEEDGENSWKCSAEAIFSVTRDKENWVETRFPLKSYDAEPENAIATVMMAIANKVNNPEFFEQLSTALDELDDELEEAESISEEEVE